MDKVEQLQRLDSLISITITTKPLPKQVLRELIMQLLDYTSNNQEDSKTLLKKLDSLILLLTPEELVNYDNETILHRACKSKQTSHFTLLHLLKNNKFKNYINAQDSEGRTPVMLAIASNQLKGAKTLIEYGADVTILDNQQKNILFYFTNKESSHPASLNMLDDLLKMPNININQLSSNNEHIGFTSINTAYLTHLIKNEHLLDLNLFLNTKNNQGNNIISHVIETLDNLDKGGSSTQYTRTYTDKIINTTKWISLLMQLYIDKIDFHQPLKDNKNLLDNISDILAQYRDDKKTTFKNVPEDVILQLEQTLLTVSSKPVQYSTKNSFKV